MWVWSAEFGNGIRGRVWLWDLKGREACGGCGSETRGEAVRVVKAGWGSLLL